MLNYFFLLAFSLSLQASRECQSKEKLLEQGFRSACREFQQWLVNAKINTAKCFDVPQNLSEALCSLQKIQVRHLVECPETDKCAAKRKSSQISTTCRMNRVLISSLLRLFSGVSR